MQDIFIKSGLGSVVIHDFPFDLASLPVDARINALEAALRQITDSLTESFDRMMKCRTESLVAYEKLRSRLKDCPLDLLQEIVCAPEAKDFAGLCTFKAELRERIGGRPIALTIQQAFDFKLMLAMGLPYKRMQTRFGISKRAAIKYAKMLRNECATSA